jgi:hypothetical protein
LLVGVISMPSDSLLHPTCGGCFEDQSPPCIQKMKRDAEAKRICNPQLKDAPKIQSALLATMEHGIN